MERNEEVAGYAGDTEATGTHRPHVCLFLPGGRTLGDSERPTMPLAGASTVKGVARLDRAP